VPPPMKNLRLAWASLSSPELAIEIELAGRPSVVCVCLPGTHTWYVRYNNLYEGSIRNFEVMSVDVR
jgi:hypothetical protein